MQNLSLDIKKTKALLVGISDYQNLDPIEPARNNIEDLFALLTNEQLLGLPSENIKTILNKQNFEYVEDGQFDQAIPLYKEAIVTLNLRDVIDPKQLEKTKTLLQEATLYQTVKQKIISKIENEFTQKINRQLDLIRELENEKKQLAVQLKNAVDGYEASEKHKSDLEKKLDKKNKELQTALKSVATLEVENKRLTQELENAQRLEKTSAAAPIAPAFDQDFTETIGDVSFDMVFIEGGRFQMGSNELDYEKPIHEVRVPDFYMGKYPVNQKLWRAVMVSGSVAWQL